ncbi:hypothetical protein K505DRAFT_333983 [Melanomma pulvis-pyrius CBS 109.77]|uniref:Uncharacterized protein n=1 Tax=Melanomma pulvis-pyrius CBS 109.77 TaxID=1314802 RepID=A0A6A6XMI3_9PLEO|nr:hypothetical protein K505DRAFT_333983 [Melanomma pulvis-pyrius CBS 109.77]
MPFVRSPGGYGSNSDHCLDPTLAGAHVLVHLQTIVSSELGPHEFAADTCGNFRASHTARTILDFGDLSIDTRAYHEEWMVEMESAIKNIIELEYTVANMNQRPDITHSGGSPTT